MLLSHELLRHGLRGGRPKWQGRAMAAVDEICTDPTILDQWHPLAALNEIGAGVVAETMLLGQRLSYRGNGKDDATAWVAADPAAEPIATLLKFGYLWACLGEPPAALFDIAEYDEPDRRNLNSASIGVHCSAPRAVENFLDMGHFPFVHTGYLGEEPHSEVLEYQVSTDPDTGDLWATECLFWQPMAAASSTNGQMVDYLYRVPHPYCTLLYKSCPGDESRMDVVALFNQPMTATHIRGHMLMSYLDDANDLVALRHFAQTIFAQDKPILENQYPKELPLDPRAETPIRADKIAIAYRRWLSELGVTYGVIPA
ncbi:MAG: phenylpropionate dioxygenase-like ring-hydroxylating dioxygenase large terminal subunit [Paracrocinitomix sp.]|jgi:phenylpropionate dioxygenase-like ring-hydroxylating dioxygenase large terminal subunit